MMDRSTRWIVFRCVLASLAIALMLGTYLPTRSLATEFIKITAENAADVRPLASLAGEPRSVNDSIFSSDSRHLLVRSTLARWWDMASFEDIRLLEGTSLALSPNNRWIVVLNRGVRYLVDLQTGEARTILASGDVIFSPDSSLLMTYFREASTIRLWDTATLREIPAPTSAFTFETPKFTPDSKAIVYYDVDSTLKLWGIQARQDRAALVRAANTVTFSNDGTLLLTHDSDSFTLWQVADAKQLAAVERGVVGYLVHAMFSPDARRLLFWDTAYSLQDVKQGKAQLWDISQPTHPRLITELKLPTAIAGFQFSPDSHWLASFGTAGDSMVSMINAATGKSEVTFDGKVGFGSDFQISSDGRLIIIEGLDQKIRFWKWDGSTATEVAAIPGTNFVLSPDETTIASVIDIQVTLIYGIPTAERPARPFVVPGKVTVSSAINVHEEPRSLSKTIGTARGDVLVGGRNGDLLFLPNYGGWVLSDYIQLDIGFPIMLLAELDTTTAVAQIPSPTVGRPTITPMPRYTRTPTFTPGPPPTLSSTVIPRMTADVPSSELMPITANNLAAVKLLKVLPDSIESTYSSLTVGVVSLDSSKIVTTSWEKTTVWSLQDFSHLGGFDVHLTKEVVASPRGDIIAYKEPQPNVIFFWDIASKQESSQLDLVPGDRFQGMMFSPDGSLLVTFANVGDGKVQVRAWDVATRTARFTFIVDSQIAFSGDSSLIAALTGNPYELQFDTIHIYDAAIGSERNTFKVNIQGRSQLLFSPDAASLLIIQNEKISIWTPLGEMIGEIAGKFTNAIFSPTGQFLATLDGGNVLRLWQLRPFQLLTAFQADSKAGMAFSPDSTMIVVGNPLRFVVLQTGESIPIEGNYAVSSPSFTPDGKTLLITGGYYTMIFGVPIESRPAWSPIRGHVIPSSMNVRSLPAGDGRIIGYASGDVLISGRTGIGEEFVYLPELKGWIRSDRDYLALGEHTLLEVPLIYVPPP